MLSNIKSKIMSWSVSVIAPMVSIFYHPEKWPYTISDLLAMPTDSLGKQTALLLIKHNYGFVPKYESHDCKHVLLNYQMNSLGESRMAFFALGNGNKSFITFISILLSIFLFPWHYKLFYQDYLRGKQCINIAQLNFAELVHMPCSLLQTKIIKQS